MRPKIKVIISLLGAVFFIFYGVYQTINHASQTNAFALDAFLSFIIFTAFIFSVITKDIKICQSIFITWTIACVLFFCYLFCSRFLGNKYSNSPREVLFVTLLDGGIWGLEVFILWLGLNGLKKA